MPVTNNEVEIRDWAVRRLAHPVEMQPYLPDGEPAQLGFVFGDPEQAREHMEPISWERFFAVFHLMRLVLRYDGDNQYELLRMEDEVKPTDGMHPTAS